MVDTRPEGTQSIVNRLADDVVWRAYMEPVVPWGGDYTGRANVPKFFDAIYANVLEHHFDPREFVTQGDTVISLGRFAGKSRGTGKAFDTSWAFVWKFRDGKVASYEQFHDPAIAEAFR